jgi:hypothetical protein
LDPVSFHPPLLASASDASIILATSTNRPVDEVETANVEVVDSSVDPAAIAELDCVRVNGPSCGTSHLLLKPTSAALGSLAANACEAVIASSWV